MGTDALGLKAMKLARGPRAVSTRLASAFKPVDNPPVFVLAGKVFRKLGSIRSPQDITAVARWVVRGFGNVTRRGRLKMKRRLRQRREARRAARMQQVAMDVPAWIRLAGSAGHLPGASQLTKNLDGVEVVLACLLYTSPSPRDKRQSRMPSSA